MGKKSYWGGSLGSKSSKNQASISPEEHALTHLITGVYAVAYYVSDVLLSAAMYVCFRHFLDLRAPDERIRPSEAGALLVAVFSLLALYAGDKLKPSEVASSWFYKHKSVLAPVFLVALRYGLLVGADDLCLLKGIDASRIPRVAFLTTLSVGVASHVLAYFASSIISICVKNVSAGHSSCCAKGTHGREIMLLGLEWLRNNSVDFLLTVCFYTALYRFFDKNHVFGVLLSGATASIQCLLYSNRQNNFHASLPAYQNDELPGGVDSASDSDSDRSGSVLPHILAYSAPAFLIKSFILVRGENVIGADLAHYPQVALALSTEAALTSMAITSAIFVALVLVGKGVGMCLDRASYCCPAGECLLPTLSVR